ncbi:hypothetical protein STRIP9103_08261 [Streptomyces ipomoeae 91-03]|uniref:Uncharacterized protein n=1 Tax=Streptomyces ipomoeae 91-03 TaxID=698759 RepID=L1L022_9ACTN|nr:hypothetical protein STRIP9103_08261 [Streptomyces ipomoeae 91-03]
MDDEIRDHLGAVRGRRGISVRQMNRAIERSRPAERVACGAGRRVPGGGRIGAQQIPVERVADLLDHAAVPHERGHPELLGHEVVDEVTDRPPGTGRGRAPLVPADGVDAGAEEIQCLGVPGEQRISSRRVACVGCV